MEGSMVYDIYYSIWPHIYPVRRVQIYPGSGSDDGIFWRQRITNKKEELLAHEFIEAAGHAIESNMKYF
jgi:hypothetical protein